MIKSTELFDAAITGRKRRIVIKVLVDISSPDIIYGTVESNSEAVFSRPEQIHNKVMGSNSRRVTLERNRWLLGRGFRLFPEGYTTSEEIGYVSEYMADSDGVFSTPVWVEERFTGVNILQALTIRFPDNAYDGYPTEFTVEVKQGETAYFTKKVTGNAETSLSIEGFTVYNPTAIRLTVNKWSLPGRRVRIPEIVAGVYEEWDGKAIVEFSATQEGNPSCLSVPYGTLVLSINNTKKRFEPRNKQGIFKSIEERQGLEAYIGVRLDDGTYEYKPLGVFYQYSDGWKQSNNGTEMKWYLVDILGLLADRTFVPPNPLPTTLEGWIIAVLSQLGASFTGKHRIDPSYAGLPVVANNISDVAGRTCEEILRYACMATGTWPRADASTGFLAAEPLWSQGNKVTLRNIVEYPTMGANDSLGLLIFKLYGSSVTDYVVPGNNPSSSKTVSIDNPFIHTEETALVSARQVLSMYGGNLIETSGRGNPSSEIGDVDTVWLDESNATTGRRIYQSFEFSEGVLQSCRSTLAQPDGSFLFQERALILESGKWIAPSGVSQLRVAVGNGGDGGTNGTDGSWDAPGVNGTPGSGGKVLYVTTSINEAQEFNVSIGAGGTIGQKGGTTTFGEYSGDDGRVYSPAFTDISNGDAFGRTGVASPLSNTGDGGAGGLGGRQGREHFEQTFDKEGKPSGGEWVVDVYPGKGTPGKPGASGFVLVYWDKEA